MQTYENLAPQPPIAAANTTAAQHQQQLQLHLLQLQQQNAAAAAAGQQHQQRAQHQAQQQAQNGTSMAAFVARLMSLNAQELQLLHSDCELMKHLSETQLMVENRLHEISLRAKLGALQQQQLHQQQQQYHHYALAAAASSAVANQHGGGADYEPTQLALYQDYYAQAARFAAAQQQQQQQMLLATVSHQQNHNSTSSPNNLRPLSVQQQQLDGQLTQYQQAQLALDLRTSSAGSFTSNHEQQQQQQQQQSSNNSNNNRRPASGNSKSFPNPKKIKLGEFENQRTATNQLKESTASNALTGATTSGRDTAPTNKPKRNDRRRPQRQLTDTTSASAAAAATTASAQEQQKKPKSSGKKYKGEFDEPSASEVERRQKFLSRHDNYHRKFGSQCACVLGSEFRDRPVSAVLDMIERWRQMDTDTRIKSKWEIADLPKDIPLSEIKKFEELRREASNGRADFGGASKRKPLGIRGTRQFLMILYCLWGHPGRDDAMQREGYCPHCFARIKKDNEQSTLVRVVNHFNMKHRRGANPRLSPNRDHDTPPAASPPANVTTNSKSKAKTSSRSITTNNETAITAKIPSTTLTATPSPSHTSLSTTTTATSSPEPNQQRAPTADDNQSDSENNCHTINGSEAFVRSSKTGDDSSVEEQASRLVSIGNQSTEQVAAKPPSVSSPKPPVEQSDVNRSDIKGEKTSEAPVVGSVDGHQSHKTERP